MQLGDGQRPDRAEPVGWRAVRRAADVRGMARELDGWRRTEGHDAGARATWLATPQRLTGRYVAAAQEIL